jgi:hypothetical protein
VIPAPVVDGRRFESFFRELRRIAPHYTPDLNLSDEESAGVALMKICAHLAETVAVRLDQTPQKHFVAFLDSLGISLLPARPARVAVTFKLASGLEESVRVPIGTRVTAPGVEDEIPFETTGELIAIPGALKTAYGVDPLSDKIFHHPPHFLDQVPRRPTELEYTIQSFVPSQANRLQLDHTTELDQEPFILIGGTEKAVVAKVDEGGFVTLAKGVSQNFPGGTVVLPVRDFEVFNGIDIQEHVLYIAHADLFTVKEEIEIKLQVALTSEAGLQPLDLVWQFWTKDENAVPEEDEHWEDLTLRSDGTNGLSSNGTIVLLKKKDREIKPSTVAGRESRWIRAQLKEKLPVVDPPRSLPEIETITVGVNTGAPPVGQPQGIPADQGFHNATPLDVQVEPGIGFFPFGTEPRQFDQFYIASKEAFSKRKARVSLDFKLDLQTLAGPSVVRVTPLAGTARLRAYSIGIRRTLFELDLVGQSFKQLGSPFDTPTPERPQGSRYFPIEDSVPSVITNAAGNSTYAFVRTEDALDNDPTVKAGKVWVHFQFNIGSNTAPIWTDLNGPPTPGKRALLFNPAAVVLPTGWPPATFARVFAVGADKRLYFRDISSSALPTATDWQPFTAAGEPSCSSSPFVTVSGSTLLVFVSGENGVVHRLAVGPTGPPQWTPLTPSQSTNFTAVSRPFAQVISGSDAKVFVVGTEVGATNRKLFECDSRGTAPFSWVDLGAPTGGIPQLGEVAPSGFVEDAANTDLDVEGKHIFVRSFGDELWERLDGDIAPLQPQWENRTRAGDPQLREAPSVFVDTSAAAAITLNVFSASARNSIVLSTFEINRGPTLTGADRLAVLLAQTAPPNDDAFHSGDSFTTSGGENSTVGAYDGRLKVVRLQTPLTALPGTDDLFIAGNNVGKAEPDTNHLITLHAGISGRPTTIVQTLRIEDDFVDLNALEFYSRLTGVVSLNPPPAGAFTKFALYVELIPDTHEFLSVDTSSVPELSWEYFNGRGWLSLPVIDGTRNLLSDGQVTIASLPSDIESTEVAGQENFWIRARLVGGDYGRETFKISGTPPNQTIVSEKSSLRPPKVRQLRILYVAEPVAPQICLTFNNLDYLDQTAASQTPDSHFPPFKTLEDVSLTLFLGFDKSFKSGPVRILIDAAERSFDETRPPEFDWRFRKDRIWKKLDAEDGSVALTREGILTLSAAEQLTQEIRFGESLFWIKGSLRPDRLPQAEYALPLLRGMFLNTVMARHGETVIDEIVGSGDGEANQTHKLQHADVLEGEDIRIEETLPVEEREQIERDQGKEAVTDREDIGGTWVQWKQVKALFDCDPADRCYEIDRATGVLSFGDGEHGRIPPAGVDNIRAFRYRSGGGTVGNVDADQIKALATAVAGIESVFNPTPAGGGSDKATNEEMLTIGPRQLSHRDRAVSEEDFEELAYEASRQVAKVRCLRATNLVRTGVGQPDPCDPEQRHEALDARGFVSLIIVPVSKDPQPCPSLELRRVVKDYLRERAPSLVAAGERIVVRPPDYVTVVVEASIFVTSLENAAAVERDATATIKDFLHPVFGGPDGTGWEFGRPLSASDVFAKLERITDVDRVEDLQFHFRGRTDANTVEVGPNELLAGDDPLLRIEKAE